MTKIHYYFLCLILLLGFSFRIIGLNWDQNQHLHPDERFLTMVAGSLSWPASLNQYFDTETSPANPNNHGFDFFVYGTYPVLFIKGLADLFSLNSYNALPLVGRFVSALLDTAVIYLIYAISRQMFPESIKAALWAAFVYSVMVLPIQLSHFFTTDPYVNFFLVLSFYIFSLYYRQILSVRSVVLAVFLGLSLGLSITAKVSAVIALPVFAVGFLLLLIRYKAISRILLAGSILLVTLFITVRFFQPYLFSGPSPLSFQLNPGVINAWKLLDYYDQPNHVYPPGTQWVHIQKGLFPLINLLFWGLGLPLGIIFILSLVYLLIHYKKNALYFLTGLLIIGIFIYHSFQYSQPLRYFYPIYPFIAIIIAPFLIRITGKSILRSLVIIMTLIIWPVFFISIYVRPNSRIQASFWIYNNIPSGSRLSCEYWDDCLPLTLSGHFSSIYQTVQLSPYDHESNTKWQTLLKQLSSVDYLILSSNRLYGSITTDPDFYPQTNTFYQSLFNGSLGFTKVAEFTSRPNIDLPFGSWCIYPPFNYYGIIDKDTSFCPQPGISVVDDYADETFTVYDHPKVVIFKKTSYTVTKASRLLLVSP